MPAAPFVYVPQEVDALFGGIGLNGFSDGSMIVITPNEDAMTLNVGADGEATVVVNANQSFGIRVTLQQASPINDYLSSIWALNRKGVGFRPFMLRDRRGTTFFSAPYTWVKKLPELQYNKEQQNREWELETNYADLIIGGNVPATL